MASRTGKKSLRREKPPRAADAEAQTAMEYVTTYGWSVLIIALVLAALAILGILNLATSAPRASPGSCSIYRPYGPGTSSMANLEGICSNELPRYVMESRGPGDFVFVPGSGNVTSPMNITGNHITITAWVQVNGAPYHDVIDKENQYGMKINYGNSPHACSPSDNPGLCLEWDTSNDWNGVSYPIPGGAFGKWAFVAVEMNGNYKYWYANGQLIGSESVNGGIAYVPSNFVIGAITPGYAGYGSAEWFNGSLSNVQLYNSSLSSNQILLMYNEGLGGTPVQIQNLIGWWPLNGNANDYSGNENNGYIYNNSFTGSLTINNYSLP